MSQSEFRIPNISSPWAERSAAQLAAKQQAQMLRDRAERRKERRRSPQIMPTWSELYTTITGQEVPELPIKTAKAPAAVVSKATPHVVPETLPPVIVQKLPQSEQEYEPTEEELRELAFQQHLKFHSIVFDRTKFCFPDEVIARIQYAQSLPALYGVSPIKLALSCLTHRDPRHLLADVKWLQENYHYVQFKKELDIRRQTLVMALYLPDHLYSLALTRYLQYSAYDTKLDHILARVLPPMLFDREDILWGCALRATSDLPSYRPHQAKGSVTCAKEYHDAPKCVSCLDSTQGSQWVEVSCGCAFHYDCVKYLHAICGSICPQHGRFSHAAYQRSRKTRAKPLDLGCQCPADHTCFSISKLRARGIDVSQAHRPAFIARAMSTPPKLLLGARKPKFTAEDLSKMQESQQKLVAEIRDLKKSVNTATTAAREATKPQRKQLRNIARTVGPEFMARADDMPVFQATGKSDYLRSVLAPDTGPAQIPDDVVQQCHVKAETVTYNLDVAESGSGVLLLLPEHPSDLIGYHYVQNSMGQMTFDKSLRTAQNLPDNYDYARRVSQLLSIKSSTVPSGVFALNGTFNAVRVEGTLSEIPSLSLTGDEFYNGILTNTVDVLDKVGNVLVGDGLAVLSLMGTIDQPFTRLGDTTPSSISLATMIENGIIDQGQSLQYHYVANGDFSIPSANAQTKNLDMTLNLDSTTGFVFDLSVVLSGVATSNPYGVSLILTPLDPFGNTVTTSLDLAPVQVISDSGSDNAVANFHISLQNYQGPPIAALRVEVFGGYSFGSFQGKATYYLDVVVPGAAKLGINRPVVVVAYQGVAAGSVITLGGVTNYELIPNPVLRQNLQLSNGYADEQELEYAKNLLHARHRIGLKSIWKLTDYWAMRPALEELSDVTVSDQAHAMGSKDFVKFIKKKFFPALVQPTMRVLSDAYPEFSPAFNVIGNTARAASGLAVRRAMNVKPTHAKEKKGVISLPKWRVVMFPTILTGRDNFIYKGAELFAVTNVKPKKMVFDTFTKSVDGKSIYGISNDAPYPFPIGVDLYVFAIDPVAAIKRDVRIVHGDPVSGTSAQAAIYLAAHGDFGGFFPVPITGELDKTLNVLPNPAFSEKRNWLAARGLSLAGNDPAAKPIIKTLEPFL